jgi:hypothetical protein
LLALAHADAQQTNVPIQRTETRVVMTTAAKFQPYYNGGRFLTLSNHQHSYMVWWPLDPRFKGASTIQSNEVYTFTVVEEPSTSITFPVTNIIIPDVVRIEQGGRVIYDIEECEIHHTRMERKEVPISYGLPCLLAGEPTVDVEQRLFPHRREFVLGGCTILETSPNTKDLYVCRECRTAYENWKKEHAKTGL